MINSRFTLVVTCLIFSCILSQAETSAREGEKFQPSVNVEPISIRKNNDQTSNLELDRLAVKNVEAPKDQISKPWSIGGMVFSSLLFIYLLSTLFKPEKHQEEFQRIDKSASHNRGNYADSTANSDEPREVDNAVIEATFPMIGMNYYEGLDYEPILDQESLFEAEKFETGNGESTLLDSDNQEIKANDLQKNAEFVDKLTVVTSDKTEIDVVFELIQDLQQSHRLESVTAKRDLRRKAIWELGQTNDLRAIEPLVQTIPEADSLEKNLILDAITQIATRNAKIIDRTVLTSLEEDNTEIRKSAIRDLTNLYQSRSLVTIGLSRMTEDANREVQQIARWALEQFNQISIPSVSYASGKDTNKAALDD